MLSSAFPCSACRFRAVLLVSGVLCAVHAAAGQRHRVHAGLATVSCCGFGGLGLSVRLGLRPRRPSGLAGSAPVSRSCRAVVASCVAFLRPVSRALHALRSSVPPPARPSPCADVVSLAGGMGCPDGCCGRAHGRHRPGARRTVCSLVSPPRPHPVVRVRVPRRSVVVLSLLTFCMQTVLFVAIPSDVPSL